MALDEGIRVSKFQSDMLLISLRERLTSDAVLAVAADSCQTSRRSMSSSCCATINANYGVSNSIVQWILDRLIAEGVTAAQMVESIDLLNRYCRSLRCRQAAAELVTSLAPLCLPGPESLWKTIIDGYKVWLALRERPATKQIDSYLDAIFPEILFLSCSSTIDCFAFFIRCI